jgi:alanine-synthesizing transaminase
MFAWSPIPDKYSKLSSLEFSKLLLEEVDIAVSPGVGFGEYGEGFVRLSIVENEQRIRQAARNLRKIMK